MRLSGYTDYALRILIYLAVQPDRLPTIGEIADHYAISKNHLTKVAHQLGVAGYIETVRGRGGGLRLGKPAEEIGVGEVVRFAEQDLAIVECMGTENECRLTPSCALKGVLGEALQAFLAVLDEYSLADITRQKRSLAALLGVEPPVQAARISSAGPKNS
jgi:Rrf2 family transcriptional regulator, nitric oxide-sensitive transcriptional repressor